MSTYSAEILQYNKKSHVALVHWAKFLEFRIFAQINSENIILSEHERPMNLIIQSAAWFWNINWVVLKIKLTWLHILHEDLLIKEQTLISFEYAKGQ